MGDIRIIIYLYIYIWVCGPNEGVGWGQAGNWDYTYVCERRGGHEGHGGLVGYFDCT